MVSAMIARRLIALAVIIAMIPAVAFGSATHQCNVTTDEHVRYQQLAMLEESRQAYSEEVGNYSESTEEWCYEESYDYLTTSYDYYAYYAASNDAFDVEDGITAAEFQWRGVVEDGEHFYTWYSERVLPGGGLTELNENGRHSEGGFVKDGDGYIAVASCDYPKGTVIDTPFGAAKVYDTGYLAEGQVDVYVSF